MRSSRTVRRERRRSGLGRTRLDRVGVGSAGPGRRWERAGDRRWPGAGVLGRETGCPGHRLATRLGPGPLTRGTEVLVRAWGGAGVGRSRTAGEPGRQIVVCAPDVGGCLRRRRCPVDGGTRLCGWRARAGRGLRRRELQPGRRRGSVGGSAVRRRRVLVRHHRFLWSCCRGRPHRPCSSIMIRELRDHRQLATTQGIDRRRNDSREPRQLRQRLRESTEGWGRVPDEISHPVSPVDDRHPGVGRVVASTVVWQDRTSEPQVRGGAEPKA